jgi:O-antigen/teichoic acid export membrane protein
MPVAARYLGAARFGLLGLAWAVTEYLTLFDLGIGRALVKFVADALHHRSSNLSEIVSLSIATQFVAGLIGGGIFFLAAPLLVHKVFGVSPLVSGEALGVFRVVAVSVPVVLLISGQRAVLEGAQRFDLSASLKMVSSVGALIAPAIGAVIGASLPAILLVVLAVRVVVAGLFAVAIRRAVPGVRWVWSRDWSVLRRVMSFGGWVLVSNTVSPLLVYLDRFALGTIVGMTAVGLYTAPYEGVTRLLLVPVSLFGSLLPALTSIEAGQDRDRFARLAASAERSLLPVMALPLSLIFVWAPELLRVWLGADYAVHSATALRILAIGVLANSLANPLLVLVYAKNRPDLPAKFHLAELVIHVPLTIWMIRAFGITGAAAAWAIRAFIDMCLLFLAAAVTSHTSVADIAGRRVGRSATAILLLVAALAGARELTRVSAVAGFAGTAVAATLFAVISWRAIPGDTERRAVRGTLGSYARLSRQTSPG